MASEKTERGESGPSPQRLMDLAAGGPHKDPQAAERACMAIEILVRREQLNAAMEALRREALLGNRGYTVLAAQEMGEDFLQAFYQGGAPGLGRFVRAQREALVAKLVQGGA